MNIKYDKTDYYDTVRSMMENVQALDEAITDLETSVEDWSEERDTLRESQ